MHLHDLDRPTLPGKVEQVLKKKDELDEDERLQPSRREQLQRLAPGDGRHLSLELGVSF